MTQWGPATLAAHRERMVKCRACEREIIFLPTSSGRSMPIDADSVEPDDEVYTHGKHVSHFSTCPHAADFRRPKPMEPKR